MYIEPENSNDDESVLIRIREDGEPVSESEEEVGVGELTDDDRFQCTYALKPMNTLHGLSAKDIKGAIYEEIRTLSCCKTHKNCLLLHATLNEATDVVYK
jgi:hypothetical protein